VVDLRVLKNHSFSSGRIPDQPSRIRSLRQPGSTAALSPNAHGISRIQIRPGALPARHWSPAVHTSCWTPHHQN
jgi:hypothetical protein